MDLDNKNEKNDKENTGAIRKNPARLQTIKNTGAIRKNPSRLPTIENADKNSGLKRRKQFANDPAKQIKYQEKADLRKPLTDLPANNATVNQTKEDTDNHTTGLQTEATCKQKSKPDSKILHKPIILNRKYVTVRKPLDSGSTSEELFDECFVDGSKHFIAYTTIPRNELSNKLLSPIRPNLYRSRMTLISQGIRSDAKKPLRKTTLTTKIPKHKHVGDIYTTEYFLDIIHHLLQNDWKNVLKKNFFKLYNPDENHRTATIDWLNQASTFLNLPSYVYFTTVRLFDKILASTIVSTNMYQLTVLVVMWIVTKLDDNRHMLTLPKLITLCNRAYMHQQFLKLEKKLLTFFNFELLLPNLTTYVTFYLRTLNLEDAIILHCVHYILECYALNSEFSTITYSIQAAGAVCLSLKILHPTSRAWQTITPSVAHYSEEQLENVMQGMIEQIHKVHDPKYEFRQPYLKYATTEKMKVSNILLGKLIAT